MVHFDVLITNRTGSSTRKAKLFLASGIIQFDGDNEFSCVEAEKNAGSSIKGVPAPEKTIEPEVTKGEPVKEEVLKEEPRASKVKPSKSKKP